MLLQCPEMGEDSLVTVSSVTAGVIAYSDAAAVNECRFQRIRSIIILQFPDFIALIRFV